MIDTDNLSSQEVLSEAITAIDTWASAGPYSPLPAPETYFIARKKFLGY